MEITLLGGYQFADFGYNRYYGGMRYTSVASTNVSWEVSTKQDLGIDFSFFDDKLSGSIDYFHERREGIYMERNYLPWVASLGTWTEYKDGKANEKDIHPYANVGIVEARGFDGNLSFRHKIDKVDLTIRGNMTYSKNEILERDEENTVYWYKMQEGHRVDQAMGLVALGHLRIMKKFVIGQNNLVMLCRVILSTKILMETGAIDDNDKVAIGATKKPNLRMVSVCRQNGKV